MKRHFQMRTALLVFCCLCVLVLPSCPVLAQKSDVTFFVRVDNSLAGKLPKNGRLFVILSKHDNPEPRLGPGWADDKAEPFFGKDIKLT